MSEVKKINLFCPSGHPNKVSAKQATGKETVTCKECGWYGTTNDGGVRVVGSTRGEDE